MEKIPGFQFLLVYLKLESRLASSYGRRITASSQSRYRIEKNTQLRSVKWISAL
ncbi:hypothetical protein M408DRAFT_284562 [Serendipita vermifera MAFF 305830]|uniref:Uncharacterized protein n=1 Tax=Serendipita vermifera MAFF 305830 TaxID=933852 RepID=A0A0C3BE06_SERVB|nr:hypothetical protein M408DRAFT_284562 [Serendipita vermifera MAFF 305830]